MSRRTTDDPPDVDAVLDRLKGFQRDTVEYAFERLYRAPDSTRRFLVADEVGLGKTLVARGVIAKAIQELWDGIDRIDIVYICSNSQIAAQNVRRLQIGSSEFVRADRLTLLPKAIRSLRGNKVNYLAFTPGTSFDLKSNMGRQDERVLLYYLVQRVWPDSGTGPKNLFQGWVTDPGRWRRQLDEFADKEQIDTALARAFTRRLREVGKGPGWGGEGLRKQYRDLCARFHRFRQNVWAEDRVDQGVFIGRLRDPPGRDLCPGARARSRHPGRVPALQGHPGRGRRGRTVGEATLHVLRSGSRRPPSPPLRHAVQDVHAASRGDEDDHYQDFLRTVEFLDPELQESGRFRALLDDYRQALYRIEDGTDALERGQGRDRDAASPGDVPDGAAEGSRRRDGDAPRRPGHRSAADLGRRP